MRRRIIWIITLPFSIGFWSALKFGEATSIEGYTTWYRALGWFLAMVVLSAPLLSPVYLLLWLLRD